MKAIIFNSLVAESIASAAIQKLKNPDAVCLDVNSDVMPADTGDVFEEIFVMVDEHNYNAKKKSVHYIKPVKKSDKKRLLLVWERCFPGQTRPIVVHLLGGFQTSEEQEEKRESLVKGIIAYAHDLSNTGFAHTWRRMLSNDLTLVNDMIEKGSSIVSYVSNTGIEEGVLDTSEADRLLKENEALQDENQKLKLQIKELKAELKKKPVKKAEPKASKTKEAAKGVSVERAQMKAMTPAQIKKNFTVKQMREVAKEVKLKNYSRMKEDQLSKELKKLV